MLEEKPSKYSPSYFGIIFGIVLIVSVAASSAIFSLASPVLPGDDQATSGPTATATVTATPLTTTTAVATATASLTAEATASPTHVPTATVTPSPAPQTYRVQLGDVLSVIAEKFGVSVEDILRANGLDDVDQITEGQDLIIPQVATPTSEPTSDTTPTATAIPTPTPVVEQPPATQTYVVQQGDTLVGIAARFGVSTGAIIQANGLQDADSIAPDQELVIPSDSSGSAPVSHMYVVEPGDSLLSIAEQFGVTVEAIMQANGLDDADMVTLGQELLIPAP